MISSLFSFFFRSDHLLPLESSPCSEKIPEHEHNMAKTLIRSIEQHQKTFPSESWIPSSTLLYKMDRELPYLDFVSAECSTQGTRDAMEDEVLLVQNDSHLLAAVFDGHAGKEVASFVKQSLAQKFFSHLEVDVHRTFSIVFNELQKEIEDKANYDSMGTTAVVCYVNRKTSKIYTATIGDSEANIYRYLDSEIRSIPLSNICNWSCHEEAARAASALKNMRIATDWPSALDPKKLRFPDLASGLNLSRALGDKTIKAYSLNPGCIPAISHEPFVTMHQLLPNDFLVLACDGVKDFVKECEIAQIIDNNRSFPDLIATRLIERAQANRSNDNMSVLVLSFKPKLGNQTDLSDSQ